MKKNNIILIILLVLFITLSVLVKFNLLNGFDNLIYKIVTINMSDVWTTFYKIITFFGSTKFIVGLVVFFVILFIFIKKNMYGYIIAGCLILSTIFNNLVKIIIRRPRPEVLHLVTERTFSYPSGHMMASVSMCGILLFLLFRSNINKKYKVIISILLCLLTVLIGISRIYLGAHYVTDIIGALLLSLTLLIIEIRLINKKRLLKE